MFIILYRVPFGKDQAYLVQPIALEKCHEALGSTNPMNPRMVWPPECAFSFF